MLLVVQGLEHICNGCYHLYLKNMTAVYDNYITAVFTEAIKLGLCIETLLCTDVLTFFREENCC